MAPQIDGTHNDTRPVLHDFYYHIENDTPILDKD